MSNEDYWAIYYTALYRNWYDIEFSPADYFRYRENHPDEIHNIDKLLDYRGDLNMIRSDLINTFEIQLKLTHALVWHDPLDPQEMVYDEEGNEMMGEIQYTAEDFWAMAEEMLTYFDDPQPSE